MHFRAVSRLLGFQCSSASRKFLNSTRSASYPVQLSSFSALQRAENSSTRYASLRFDSATTVSVLFSEPKIPQLTSSKSSVGTTPEVSVLFSEPKIPQLKSRKVSAVGALSFSALQRAENSSTSARSHSRSFTPTVSVLFSEPKIPQHRPSHLRPSIFPTAMITLRHS